MEKDFIMVCGDGGAGKSTASAWIGANTRFKCKHSTSYYAAAKIFNEIRVGLHEAEFHDTVYHDSMACWMDRGNHRQFWAEWIDQYNQDSPHRIRLYLDAIMNGEMVLDGIRKIKELEAFDGIYGPILKIWIDRPGIPRDPTQEYGPERCDLIIQNNACEQTLHRKLARLFYLK